ncbi:MAG: DUF2207 domain-containing protein, partial [Candidatus Hydrogenedentes bacterium]|nr:DUF2207 domain-containing protein [Candidatus Hydrogenedentota bacterium]
GTIPAPTPAELRAYWWRDNRISVFAFLSVIALIAYYIFAWLLVGRDPRKGRILPAEHPPGDLSPAALRYISRMGSDNLTFTVALLNMAAKGYIRIEEEGNYVISRGKAKQAVLTEEESAIAHELLPEGTDRFAFKQKYASKITKTLRDFKRTLKRNHQKPYFSRNGAYLMPGIVLSFIVVGAALFDLPGDGTLMALFLSIWLTGWTFGCVALVKGAVNAWRNIKKDEVLSYGALIGSILFSIPFLIAEVAVLGILIWNFGVTLSALILSVAVINVIFFRLMKAYTPEGRRVMDALEAFKMTLRGEGRAVLAGSGDESKQVYERYLPYAAAVGAINDWSEQLNKALVQAGQPRGNYHPRWYSVSGNDHVDVGSFTNGLSSSIANSVVSSSSSSSGGGGGGSSGGGGGGGGGGGW